MCRSYFVRGRRRALAVLNLLVASLLVSCGGSSESAPLIEVTAPAMPSTSESGAQITLGIVLARQPSAPVMIPIVSSDATEGTVSLTSVTFTTANWNAPRTITVTGANDALVDGNQTFHIVFGPSASEDPAFAGLTVDSPDLTNIDNDTAGVTVSAPSGETHESGGTATFTVVLTNGPTSDVVIGLSSSDPSEGLPNFESLTFTAENWNAPQTVTVTGVDDEAEDGPQTYAIEFDAPQSADPAYATLAAPQSISFVNGDNDTAGIIVGAPSGPTTEAGGSATFTVRLVSPPTANVTVNFASNDSSEGTTGVSSLTFTTANWSTNQTVTVTGVDDLLSDGNQPYAIVFTAQTSSDPLYAALAPPANVAFINNDDEIPGITVSAADFGGKTSEIGWTSSFTVVLGAQPSGDVSLHFDSNDTGEGEPDATSLTFTTANWNAPQTVTVTGVDDASTDGAQPYAIVFTAQTGDPLYAALPPPANIVLANYDDETPFRMRSTYVEGGFPYYVGHARFGGAAPGAASNHVVLARLNEPSMTADDFRFWIVRGLADTNDASLMSFELASIPGSYARFDSAMPTRWPGCSDGATYGWANCMFDVAPVDQRHHMLWVDPLVDDATYRSNATFERRESQNGTVTMTSFAWHHDDTVYLRHASYQLVGRTVGSPAQNNDASFTLEQ